MVHHVRIPLAAFVFGLVAVLGCDQSAPVAPDAGSSTEQTTDEPQVRGGPDDEQLSLEQCAFGRRDFTLRSRNDYFPLGVGSSWVLRGTEDGKEVELRIKVLNETERVGAVKTRVVEERHFEKVGDELRLVEHSRNFFAATKEGTVCYFGETVDIYEDGEIVSHEGAWRADAPGNFPGIIMPAHPRVGMTFHMEGAPGIAEDEGTIVDKGVRVRVPAGTFKNTIRIRETNPLSDDVSFKVFARGVGIVIDGPLSLVRYRIANGKGRDGDDDEGKEDDG
jgi:hypothetical protein